MFTTILRRSAIVTLCGVLGFGAWKWDQLGHDEWENAGARLEERLALYVDLRMQDDWPALYEMVDPMHRGRVSLKAYLNFFDHDVVKTLELRASQVQVEPVTRTARAKMFTRGEFRPDKLPDRFRRGFRKDGSPEDYISETEFDLSWRWVDDQWFYQLDREFLVGRTDSGSNIAPLDEAAENAGGGPR